MLLAVGLQPLAARAQAAAEVPPPWTPPPEPAAWVQVRTALLEQGPPEGLARREWVFVRALDRADLRAGEYLADPVPAADGPEPLVAFRAVVLLQRPATGPAWQVRERRMRARCDDRRLEVQDPDGAWVAYAGTPDPQAPARLAWICRRAVSP
ncbi:conserved hypothetical protein [Cyanobium sp. PCC 7001]|uniref:hypothetical protein n=1 Tax=Cyanobium sp. PCC 7001 TaxID=180281 RepID=UPI0001804C70|nr:hypothetical protein [Cyanobium sp. PCC 7001]EDY37592.1 conserved hypothetical protein [Cyanobium sp. PCC 7001]